LGFEPLAVNKPLNSSVYHKPKSLDTNLKWQLDNSSDVGQRLMWLPDQASHWWLLGELSPAESSISGLSASSWAIWVLDGEFIAEQTKP